MAFLLYLSMYKQKQSYGCGLYAVANALKLPESFISKDRLRESMNGTNNGKLSQYLQANGLNMYLETIYFNANGSKLPKQITSILPMPGAGILPIILATRLSKDGKPHLISGHLHANGELLLFDSLRDGEVMTTISRVNEAYPAVFGIYVFAHPDSTDFVFIS